MGSGIDKPARYDRIKIKHKEVPQEEVMKNLKKEKERKKKGGEVKNEDEMKN